MSIKDKFPWINLSVSLTPTSALPVDRRSLFDDMDELREAAASAVEVGSADSNYYFGEILTYKSPDGKTVENFKIVNREAPDDDPYGKNLLPVAMVDNTQMATIVQNVIDNPFIVNLNSNVELLKNPQENSGLAFNVENGLKLKLGNDSGLKLTDDGLGLNIDNKYNVELLTDEDGLSARYGWKEYKENE